MFNEATVVRALMCSGGLLEYWMNKENSFGIFQMKGIIYKCGRKVLEIKIDCGDFFDG